MLPVGGAAMLCEFLLGILALLAVAVGSKGGRWAPSRRGWRPDRRAAEQGHWAHDPAPTSDQGGAISVSPSEAVR
jgi:hypothetical protein